MRLAKFMRIRIIAAKSKLTEALQGQVPELVYMQRMLTLKLPPAPRLMMNANVWRTCRGGKHAPQKMFSFSTTLRCYCASPQISK